MTAPSRDGITDPDPRVASTYAALADLLEGPESAWDAPSLCEGWRVRHVVAHVTMPVRLTPEQFGAEMAAAGGDFTVLSNAVAESGGRFPVAELVGWLRDETLHAWEPPGGGAAGALSHAVIHALDVTVALGVPPVASQSALVDVLDSLVAAEGAIFGIDLTGVRLEATDASWMWGSGRVESADLGGLVALVSGRTLPDGRSLPRR